MNNDDFYLFTRLMAKIDMYEMIEDIRNKKMKWKIRFNNKRLNEFVVDMMMTCYQLGFTEGMKFAKRLYSDDNPC